MKRYTELILTLCLSVTAFIPSWGEKAEMWYRQPADEWMKALPIGNGRLGAMIYGGVQNETIALNESTMWSGEYNPIQDRPFGRERMRQLQQMSLEGKLDQVDDIAANQLTGRTSSFGTHLPIGDLKLAFTLPAGEVTEYRRALDLENAVATTTFRIDDVVYTREYIASNPDDVVAMNFSASRKGCISLTMSLDLLRDAEIRTEGRQLLFEGQALFPKQGRGGVCFMGRIAVDADGGELSATDRTLTVTGANAVKIITDVRTNFKNDRYKDLCFNTMERALALDFTTLKHRHIADYAPLFARVALTLGDADNSSTPTDERRMAIKNGQKDPGLQALFLQYGRYLTIASSRKNSPLPIALQGFFNDNLACNMGWTNDYHLDINTQQNYWLTNVGNLAECNEPLFRYIADLAYYGHETAQKVYGCRGWTAHTTANVWGFSALSGGMWWGLFPTAGSWIASHLWTQYAYTQDNNYLEHTAYPLLKGNAQFLLDYMIEDPQTGYLLTGPSISPENSFGWNGRHISTSMMPTCDRVLVHEIFDYCIQASDILGIDKSFADSLRVAIDKLPPLMISPQYGGIQEWYKDYDDVNANHRHTSHLLALFPFAQISMAKTPELANAARTSLERRLSAQGWEDVEWSRGNTICYYARLKDAPKAEESVNILLTDLSRENLFTISPKGIAGAPYDIFAFDGNTSGAAGIAEMLVQSHEGFVELLPCLPREWNCGSFKGLCVRGGAQVAASWEKGKVTSASLTATADGTFTLKMPRGKFKTYINGREQKSLVKEGFVTVDLAKGNTLEIR